MPTPCISRRPIAEGGAIGRAIGPLASPAGRGRGDGPAAAAGPRDGLFGPPPGRPAAAPRRRAAGPAGGSLQPAAATARLAITVTRWARYSALPWMSPFRPSGDVLHAWPRASGGQLAASAASISAWRNTPPWPAPVTATRTPVGRLGHEHADHGVARGRVAELGVAGLRRDREVDRGDELARLQRGGEHALEEVVGRRSRACRCTMVAPSASTAGGIVGGRVVVGDASRRWCRGCAPAVSPIAPASAARAGIVAFTSALSATSTCVVIAPMASVSPSTRDARQLGDAGQVDHVGRLGQPLLQRRHQGLAAGERPWRRRRRPGALTASATDVGLVIGEIVHASLAWRLSPAVIRPAIGRCGRPLMIDQIFGGRRRHVDVAHAVVAAARRPRR